MKAIAFFHRKSRQKAAGLKVRLVPGRGCGVDTGMGTFYGIQAMRGVAAVSVVLCHLLIARFGFHVDGVMNALTGVLRTGVDLFFVISGFVITLAAAEAGKTDGRYGTLKFAFRRLARVYPLYWIVLAAAILSSYLIGSSQGWPDIPQLLSAQYIFLTVPVNWFVPQAWSLAYEVHFYLAVAIVLLLVPKRVTAALVVAACALALLDLLPPFPLFRRVPLIIGQPLTLEFAFGVVVAFLATRNLVRGWPASLAMAATFYAAGICLNATSAVYIEGLLSVATFGVASALLVYSVVAAERSGAKFPGWLLYLGDISYSLYLWHLLILTWLASFVGNHWTDVTAVTVWLAIILAFSAASFHGLEEPVRRWARNIWPRSAKPSQLRAERNALRAGNPVHEIGVADRQGR